jgi:hypothetical protein
MLHLDLGQQEEAIEYLSKVEPSDPNYPHAMAIGGSIALTQNQNQTALGFFSKAGEMADDMAKVASNRIQKDKVQDGNPSHNDNTQQGEEFTSSSKNSSDSYPNRSNFTSCEYTGGELIYR